MVNKTLNEANKVSDMMHTTIKESNTTIKKYEHENERFNEKC